ncbi:unnamed protein product [Victoria cruziana]
MISSSTGGGVFRCSAIAKTRNGDEAGRVFPAFLPVEIERIRDRATRRMARRIERLPVKTSLMENCIMSSCVKPLRRTGGRPVVLLHGFDSSCLEWRYAFPLLEDAGLETWAVDVLGWGFSDLVHRFTTFLIKCFWLTSPPQLYVFHLQLQFFRSYITRPLVLVGASLGAAVAIDFAINYPEFVSELVLIDASVYAEGTGRLSRLPRPVAYAGVSLLKSIPLRLVASLGMYNNTSLSTIVDRTTVSLLHCLLPWWDDATVDFMLSGGYNVIADINQVEQKALIIWGEDDKIISSKFAKRLHEDIPNSILHMIPDCGHVPHVEKPNSVAKLILDFVCKEAIKLKILYKASIRSLPRPMHTTGAKALYL